MEHRWGKRRPLEVDVQVYVRPGQPMCGRLLNASSSGGYVATTATLPILTRVHVTLGWDSVQRGRRNRIAAYVARSDAGGIGLEWQEFAPLPVLALIDALEPWHVSPPGIRPTTQEPQELAYIPRSHSGRAFVSAPGRG